MPTSTSSMNRRSTKTSLALLPYPSRSPRISSAQMVKKDAAECSYSGSKTDIFETRLKFVLEIYNERGALDADNALDLIETEFRKSGKAATQCISELQIIIRSELGQELPNKSEKIGKVDDTLVTAIHIMYQFICSLEHNPMQAAQIAPHLLAYHEKWPSTMPQAWMHKVASTIKKSNTPTTVATDTTKDVAGKNMKAAECWRQVVHNDIAVPPVMADVLRMVGIEEVKAAFVRLYHRAMVAKVQQDRSAFSYNACFVGNPGTGKTTIARYYCDFLKQIKVLPEHSSCIEISGSSLSYQGVAFLDNALNDLKKAGGGVIFIDEAYQLLADRDGLKVLDFILPLSEGLDTKYGCLVWVFSGYCKDMEKLMAHNAGMASRFPTNFVFKDYSDEELIDIFLSLLVRDPANSAKPPTPASEASPAHLSVTSKSPKRVGVVKSGVEQDKFGNSWTFDGRLWHDVYGSSSKLGPDTVGNQLNPLVSVDFKSWTYNTETKLWKCSTGETICKYPGNPQNTAEHTNFRRTPFKCENGKYVRIAMRRLGRQRGRIGFGNARAVQAYFDQVRCRQSDRIRQEELDGRTPNVFLLKREDLLGPRVTEASIKQSRAYRDLQALEGLAPVKQAVDDLIELAVRNALREEEENPILDIVINRIFLGNPGTGKTTVAKLYGELLVELGLLSKGRVIIRNPSDFVGTVLGSSEKQTRDILRSAEGCVLVIDEAYLFYSGSEVGGSNSSYNSAVINTIVEQVQATPGDDRAVLLLGYEAEMETMLKNVNPGLSRRFQLEFAFRFPDYDDSALLRILLTKIRRDKLRLDFQVAKQAISSLSKSRAKPHFGNAGAVENLLSEAKIRSKSHNGTLSLCDFGLEQMESQESILMNIFDDLIGCDDIKSKLSLLQSTVQFAKRRGEDPKQHVCYNYLFLGNAGTGKTTVARRMGKMFKALGLLPDDTVHSISPSDFLTGFLGQTSRKTRDVLQRSKGGVLLIDEAYQLDPSRGGNYMSEAADELVRCLTCPEFEGKMLIILAGYHAEMDRMLTINQGLKSRFAEQLCFEDMDVLQTRDLLIKNFTSRKLDVEAKEYGGLAILAQRLVASPGFANGRDINTWGAMTFQQVASRGVGVGAGTRNHVTLEEISSALELMLKNRKCGGSERQNEISALAVKGNSVNQQEFPIASLACAKIEMCSQQESQQVSENKVESEPTASTDADVSDPVSKEIEVQAEFNPFKNIDKLVLEEIQQFLELNNLNNQEGVSNLVRQPLSDETFRDLMKRLVNRAGLSTDKMFDILMEWVNAQKELMKQLEAHRTKSSKMQAIWRCAVCGKADKPWIACYVAPFILRYEPVG